MIGRVVKHPALLDKLKKCVIIKEIKHYE